MLALLESGKLSRQVCTTCGHISPAVVPMQCWATTPSGVRCRAFSLKSSGPMCLAHAHASIDWRQAVLTSVAVRSQPPKVGTAVVIQLATQSRPKEIDAKSHLVLVAG